MNKSKNEAVASQLGCHHYNFIVPGGTWNVPNTGRHMQARGTGIVQIGDIYYAVGENKTIVNRNLTKRTIPIRGMLQTPRLRELGVC